MPDNANLRDKLVAAKCKRAKQSDRIWKHQVLLFEEGAKGHGKTMARTLLPSRVNKEIIYDRYTMIVINRISTGRQNVPLCEELRFPPLASILPRTIALSIFYRENAIHGQHNLSVFKYVRADRFTYFNINS